MGQVNRTRIAPSAVVWLLLGAAYFLIPLIATLLFSLKDHKITMVATDGRRLALVDEEEATLKRLRRKGDSIALEPANPTFETRIFGPDRVNIQGRLVGLMRRF